MNLHDDLGARFFDVVDGFFPGDEVFQGDAVHAEFENEDHLPIEAQLRPSLGI